MNFPSTRRLQVAATLVALLAAIAVIDSNMHSAATADDEPPRALNPGDIDTELSRVYVFVGKKRLGHEHGMEGLLQEGRIRVDVSDDPGELVFDMTSFAADTDAAREYVGLEGVTDEDEQSDVTATMTGSKVLDVEEYPTATFEISSIEMLDEETDDGHPLYAFTGELTLHGETNDIEFQAATTEQEDGRVRLQGDFEIKQSEYGIRPYSAFFGTVAVTDELKIYGDLWIVTE